MPTAARSLSRGDTAYDAAAPIGKRHFDLISAVAAGGRVKILISVALWGREYRNIFVEYRSEEHTSELQSLMRISYAVFCLKKKKYNFNTHRNQSNTI